MSNTLILSHTLNVRDQVSHPQKATGKIIIVYAVMFTFSESNAKIQIPSMSIVQSAVNIPCSPPPPHKYNFG